MKKSIKHKRTFVGPKGCLGALMWTVHVAWHKRRKQWTVDGEFNVNEDAQHHWVDSHADMAPLYVMQQELDAFIEALEEGLKAVEIGNENYKASAEEAASNAEKTRM